MLRFRWALVWHPATTTTMAPATAALFPQRSRRGTYRLTTSQQSQGPSPARNLTRETVLVALPTQRTCMYAVTVWGQSTGCFVITLALLPEEAAGSRKQLPDSVVPTRSAPFHTVVTRYVMDTHVDDPAFPTDYDSSALACGGVSVGHRHRGPFKTASLSVLSQ